MCVCDICGLQTCGEHNYSILFVLFVDLKKAYDSVLCDALWQVLEKFGVLPVLLLVIRSFHEHTRASVRVKGMCSDSCTVGNEIQQYGPCPFQSVLLWYG